MVLNQQPVCITDSDGTQKWCVGFILHRLDGPAVICPTGYHAWYVNGQRHRVGGPAETNTLYDMRSERWFEHGMLHRLDGPAHCIYPGPKDWWIRGKCITKKITKWMDDRDVTWPWNESTQIEFLLTWA